jgi:hypothetical protein
MWGKAKKRSVKPLAGTSRFMNDFFNALGEHFFYFFKEAFVFVSGSRLEIL